MKLDDKCFTMTEIFQSDPKYPSEPLVLIWNPIEKLKKLATQASLLYTEQQLIEFSLQIIRGTYDFEKALGDWRMKAVRDKTWTNLKSHIAQAQEAF